MRINIPLLFKFLVGILLLQGATAIQILASLKSDQPEVRLLFGGLSVTLGVIVALWFASIAAAGRKDALARVQEGFSREREKLRVKAEKDKTRLIEKNQRQLTRERDRLRNRASLKVGAAFAGVLSLGLLMLFTQFMTVGLLTLAAGGGGAGGYLLRVRQERRRRDASEGLLPPLTVRPAIVDQTSRPPDGPRV